MLPSNEPSLQPSLFPSDEPSVIVRDRFLNLWWTSLFLCSYKCYLFTQYIAFSSPIRWAKSLAFFQCDAFQCTKLAPFQSTIFDSKYYIQLHWGLDICKMIPFFGRPNNSFSIIFLNIIAQWWTIYVALNQPAAVFIPIRWAIGDCTWSIFEFMMNKFVFMFLQMLSFYPIYSLQTNLLFSHQMSRVFCHQSSLHSFHQMSQVSCLLKNPVWCLPMYQACSLPINHLW